MTYDITNQKSSYCDKQPPVRIIAALVNPKGYDGYHAHEVVTLLNVTSDAISLRGWRLIDQRNHKTMLCCLIQAGATVTIPLDTLGARLGNDGGTITLEDVEGNVIDKVAYSAELAQQEGWTIAF